MTVQMPPEVYLRPGKMRDDILQFKAAVEGVSAEFPELVCTSWWRDPIHNAEVGGDIYSQHQIGLATDWDWIGADLDYYKRAAERGRQRGLTAVIYWTETKSYLHFQFWTTPLDTLPPAPPFDFTGDWTLLINVWDLLKGRLRKEEPTVTVKLD